MIYISIYYNKKYLRNQKENKIIYQIDKICEICFSSHYNNLFETIYEIYN